MNKEEFYNEHVYNTKAYQASLGTVDEESIMKELDNMFDRGVVSISKFNYREGMDIGSPEAAATERMDGLSVYSVNSFLKSSASSLADGEEGNQYIARITWRNRLGKCRMAITKIDLLSRDKDNDHIIEQRLCDKYVNTYERKIEDAHYHSYQLTDMLRFPEMRSFMFEEAKKYLNENYHKASRVLVEDKSNSEEKDIHVWMVPGDHRSQDDRSKGKGR